MPLKPTPSLDAGILRRADGVEAEILHEKAGALSRQYDRLTDALAALRAHDAAHPRPDAGAEAERERLVARAGEVLWFYVVQREVCGLRDTAGLLRELGVPREVELRMGPARRPGS